MTFYVENETSETFPFDADKLVNQVAQEVLEMERCPYEAQVNVLLTDNKGIHEINRECRGIDAETDVLSFPNLEFVKAGVFQIDDAMKAGCFDPDSGELILGDIMISMDRVREQAESYGHSIKREFAFLIAHSMLHLCGYDHMQEAEAHIIERKQEEALEALGITREDRD